MQKNNRTILSTRPLAEALISEAAKKNIQIDCVSFIETEPIKTAAIEQRINELKTKEIVAVFTSMNAVETVQDYLITPSNWKIYCIGHATKQLIKNFFGEKSIKATADDASALADVIIQNKEEEVFFFCGDQRREELPNKLKDQQISLEELVVYKTIPLSNKLTRNYDGVLFYSPSAVYSFFSSNQASEATVFFAIGETTAKAIQQYSNNQLIVAEKPGKEALAQQAILYFQTTQQSIRH